MELYQIEEQRLEQDDLFSEIRKFVEGDALQVELHEAEEGLFRRLQSLGLSLLKEVVARHGTGKVEGKASLQTGEILPYHDLKERKYLSIFGLLKIVRAYYWTEGASKGAYPLDKQLNLPDRRYSYLLDRWTQSGVAEKTFDEATGSLGELLGIPIWKSGQEKVAREATRDVDTFYQTKETFAPETEGPVLCATADCKGVPMVPSERPEKPKQKAGSKVRRAKGDKKKGLRRDAVVTSDFSFQPQARTPEYMIDVLMRTLSEKEKDRERAEKAARKHQKKLKPRAPLNKQVRASMFGKEHAIRDLADRIARRDPTKTKPIQVLVDGERALEQSLRVEFEQRGWAHRVQHYVLDIMHVMEYVWDAGTALFGEKNPAREAWVREKTLGLLKGRVGRVLGGLRNSINRKRSKKLKASQLKALERTARYFNNHQHMMRYDKYLELGYPIASGVIEGACGSLVKDRMEMSGMKWQREGAQAVLDLRALKRNGDWDDYWAFHRNAEKHRLYEFSVN